MENIAQEVLEAVLPDCCLHCQSLGQLICQNCRQAIEWYPFVEEFANLSQLDSVQICCLYNTVAKSMIRQLKFLGVKPAAQLMAEMMFLSLNLPKVDLIVPVPLHPDRQKSRGFNQSMEIAVSLAQLTNLTALELLTRTSTGMSQVEKHSRVQRLQLIPDLYRVKPLQNIPQSVLLVDDVITTGSTFGACALILKQVGVKQVHAVAFAHSG